MDEKQEFEMGLPNGVGEQMLAHTMHHSITTKLVLCRVNMLEIS